METVYYHNMPNIQAMIEWVKGTRLRPYLGALDRESAEELEAEIASRASSLYRRQANGEIIFRFRRFFFTAEKINLKVYTISSRLCGSSERRVIFCLS